jgi:hypothetical protein
VTPLQILLAICCNLEQLQPPSLSNRVGKDATWKRRGTLEDLVLGTFTELLSTDPTRPAQTDHHPKHNNQRGGTGARTRHTK